MYSSKQKISDFVVYDGSDKSMDMIEELCHSNVDHLEGSMFNQIYVYNYQYGSFLVREGDYVVLDTNGICSPIAPYRFKEDDYV